MTFDIFLPFNGNVPSYRSSLFEEADHKGIPPPPWGFFAATAIYTVTAARGMKELILDAGMTRETADHLQLYL